MDMKRLFVVCGLHTFQSSRSLKYDVSSNHKQSAFVRSKQHTFPSKGAAPAMGRLGPPGLQATELNSCQHRSQSLVRGAIWSLRETSLRYLSPQNRTPSLPGEFIIPTFQKRKLESGCGWVPPCPPDWNEPPEATLTQACPHGAPTPSSAQVAAFSGISSLWGQVPCSFHGDHELTHTRMRIKG